MTAKEKILAMIPEMPISELRIRTNGSDKEFKDMTGFELGNLVSILLRAHDKNYKWDHLFNYDNRDAYAYEWVFKYNRPISPEENLQKALYRR